jgi:hypothetical protein
MENAGWLGVEIVRARVPFLRLIARLAPTGRMTLLAPFSGPDFPRKHMLMISLKKPTTASGGMQQGGTGREGSPVLGSPIGHAAHSPPPRVNHPSPTASAG